MDNQVDDATVDALVGAVTSRYDIVARYYRLKRRLLGLDELFDYDRYAALPAAERRFTWAEARADGARRLRSDSIRAWRRSPPCSSTSDGSTRPSTRASAAARSAAPRSRPSTPTSS